MQEHAVKAQAREVGLIIVGNLAMGLGYAKWMVPNHIINGGVTSLSQIVNHYYPISVPMANNLWLAFLLLLTLLFLGREVFLKSVLSSVVYSASFTACFAWAQPLTITPLVDLLIASGFIAFGYYACLSSHASTVGVDVFALIIKKYRPAVNLSRVIRYFNYGILALGFVAFGFWSIAYGLVFAFIYSHELDWMLHHFKYNNSND
ncbi:YitT family protein [Lacticaseibacillus absianus]|uniref:YitT family protein n=1 Tax=Lacticaseibacillus absianus TaxID=2729623 RepID=UPI0015CD5CD9|nr:YitT family protein [Lacticaseibacillus absianus]